jgi:hypothetical protein
MPRGRPNQGKTETIKERRVDIYAPDLRVKARWDKEAERRKKSRSEMVFELVELALAAEKDPGATAPNGALSGRVEELQAQLGILRRRNQDLEALKERLERELEEYRALVATGETPLPNIGKGLVGLFSGAFGGDGRARPVDAAEVRQALGIEAADMVRMRELQQAIATLEVQGLLRKHAKGWVWLGK